MVRTTYHARRVTLIAREGKDGDALEAGLASEPRINLVARYASLGAAYSPTEAAPPDFILCTRQVASEPEFAMFGALTQMLGLRLLTLPNGATARDGLAALGLKPVTTAQATPTRSSPSRTSQRLVTIGASTGGIAALEAILKRFPFDCPPTVIVQHIKADFVAGLVERLNAATAAHVSVAQHGEALGPGRIAVAPGQTQHLVIDARGLRTMLRDGPLVSGHRPSVDVLFESAATLGPRAVGVVLTGMGRDGARGLGAMRRAGAHTIAQDAATSKVYGMPRVAQEQGAAIQIAALPDMADAILTAARRKVEAAL